MVMKRNFGVRRCVKQLNGEPRNHPKISTMETYQKKPAETAAKRGEVKRRCVFRERTWHLEWNGGKKLGCMETKRGASRFRLWKNVCALTGAAVAERMTENYAPFFPLHSSPNSLLLFKIYMQASKKVLVWNHRAIKPLFCNSTDSVWKHKFGVSFPLDAKKTI